MLQILNKKLKLGKKGFSLVELIIVIAIMAVLVAILLPQYMQYVEKSKQSADSQTVDTISNALKTMLSDDSYAGNGGLTVTWNPAVVNGAKGQILVAGADKVAAEAYLAVALSKTFASDAFGQPIKSSAHQAKTYTWTITYDATTNQPTLATTNWA